MLTDEQRQYLEEVLGVNPLGMVLGNVPAPANTASVAVGEPSTELAGPEHHELLVLTYPLEDLERALLQKILASVKLQNYTHYEQNQIELAELPEGVSAAKVLAFIDYPGGKNIFDESTWFVFPPVAQMTGANATVNARKKETWNLLQQFAKEQA